MFAIILALAHSSILLAATTTYTDFYDAQGIKLGSFPWSSTNSNSWAFNILDDGYDPLTESITSAMVSLDLRDDSNFSWHCEQVLEWAALSTQDLIIDSWEVDTGTKTITLTSLSSTGMLSMTLRQLWVTSILIKLS